MFGWKKKMKEALGDKADPVGLVAGLLNQQTRSPHPRELVKGKNLLLSRTIPAAIGDAEVTTHMLPVTFSGWDGDFAIVKHEDGEFETVRDFTLLSLPA